MYFNISLHVHWVPNLTTQMMILCPSPVYFCTGKTSIMSLPLGMPTTYSLSYKLHKSTTKFPETLVQTSFSILESKSVMEYTNISGVVNESLHLTGLLDNVSNKMSTIHSTSKNYLRSSQLSSLMNPNIEGRYCFIYLNVAGHSTWIDHRSTFPLYAHRSLIAMEGF